jgi:hypothetical protein
LAYEIVFADEIDEHLAALTARQKASVFDAIERQLPHEPTRQTRNRRPMDPDKRAYVAPWELRVGELRVYYAVEERVRIAGRDVEP